MVLKDFLIRFFGRSQARELLVWLGSGLKVRNILQGVVVVSLRLVFASKDVRSGD